MSYRYKIHGRFKISVKKKSREKSLSEWFHMCLLWQDRGGRTIHYRASINNVNLGQEKWDKQKINDLENFSRSNFGGNGRVVLVPAGRGGQVILALYWSIPLITLSHWSRRVPR